MRRAIADHMVLSRSTIPDAWTSVQIDVTDVLKTRERLQSDWQAREGYSLSLVPFMISGVLAGLRSVPALNATWQADGGGYTVHQEYNLGIAVSVEAGLVVPVLKQADQYGIGGLARQLRILVERARTGRLSVDELTGATFTVNNTGALGAYLTQAIVPVSQAGIITLEGVTRQLVVRDDDSVAIRSLMNASLSFDHRILDGGLALRFLGVVKKELEAAAFSL
jgi:2-oxoisovalerate dehydrogenase E2 component (dihydrolipoyl transacylase)